MSRTTIRRLLLAGGAAVALSAAGTGVALAAGSGPQAPATAGTQASLVSTAPSGQQATPDTSTESSAPEAESTVSDGPGGHADPAGSNVDHQFNGNE
ncbi:MAG: hypothetical protein JWO98_4088 [Frankiales bacterium]|nr:hypothetical protein [Frankiales bacterium]